MAKNNPNRKAKYERQKARTEVNRQKRRARHKLLHPNDLGKVNPPKKHKRIEYEDKASSDKKS